MQKKVEYSKAIKTKYPEAVAYAIAKDRNGMPNPITLGWVMCTSYKPPMFAIALAFKRYSCEAINHSKSFTLVFPDENQIDQAMFFGTHSGRDTDKLKEFKTKFSSASKIDSVILDDAVANFECVLDSQLETGDHVIFVGKVVASHVNTEPVGRLYTVAPGWKMSGVRKL
jgi:flavin reductase (DIM6/NTAB) family NADH-FMN oxidoreductase RutF